MITLGGIALNRSIQWVDRFHTSTVIANNRRFLAGNLRVLQARVDKGIEITLRATQTQGWLSKAQVDSLLTISDNIGVYYSLDFDGEVLEVVFDHSAGNAVEVTPLIFKPTYADSDYFVGSIRLLTV